MSDVKKIGEELKWPIKTNEQKRLKYNGLSSHYSYIVETIVDHVNVSGFINILAIFIK